MSVNVYDMVTERIIEQLKQGIIPWQRPWHGIRSGAYNRITNKPYSLMNQMLLQHDGEYASFKQWADLLEDTASRGRKGRRHESS